MKRSFLTGLVVMVFVGIVSGTVTAIKEAETVPPIPLSIANSK